MMMSSKSIEDFTRYVEEQKIMDNLNLVFEDLYVYYITFRNKNINVISLLPPIYKNENITDIIKSFNTYQEFKKNNDVYLFIYNFSENMIKENISPDDYDVIITIYNNYLENSIYKNIENKIEKIKHIIIEKVCKEIEDRFYNITVK